jgi:hypothetical protein
MLILLIIIGILILIPLGYIYPFLIIELPKKFGYFKFYLILICYVIFFGLLVFLMTIDYLNFFLFLILAMIPYLLGVYYLREEFVATIKKDFKIESGKGKD